MTKLHCTLVFSAAVLLATSPAAAVDIIWTDNLTEQILRGAADGSGSASELFGIADYPGSPGSINPLGVAVDGGFVYWADSTHRPDPAGRGRRQRVGQRAVRHRRLPRLAQHHLPGSWRSTGASSTGPTPAPTRSCGARPTAAGRSASCSATPTTPARPMCNIGPRFDPRPVDGGPRLLIGPTSTTAKRNPDEAHSRRQRVGQYELSTAERRLLHGPPGSSVAATVWRPTSASSYWTDLLWHRPDPAGRGRRQRVGQRTVRQPPTTPARPSPSDTYQGGGVAVDGGFVYWTDLRHRPDPAGRGRRQRVGQRPVRHHRLPRLARPHQPRRDLDWSTRASSTGPTAPPNQILRGTADGSGSASELFGIADYPGSPANIQPMWVWRSTGASSTGPTFSTTQILRGAADGSGSASELFAITDYPDSPRQRSCPRGVAVDGGFVYWTDPGTDQILRGAADGSGSASELFNITDYPGSPGGINPEGVAVDGAFVYWTDFITDQILRGAADGSGTAVELFNIADYPGSPGGISPLSITVVPEPNTFALAALGLVGLAFHARRRNRKLAA